MPLKHDELCQICQKSKRENCLTEKQTGLNMKSVREILIQTQAFELKVLYINHLCLFLSTLQEYEIVFAYQNKTFMNDYQNQIYFDIKLLIPEYRGNQEKIKTKLFKDKKNQDLMETTFNRLFMIASKEINGKLNTFYRQGDNCKYVIEIIKKTLFDSAEKRQLKRGNEIRHLFKEHYLYTDLSPIKDKEKVFVTIEINKNNEQEEELIEKIRELCITNNIRFT